MYFNKCTTLKTLYLVPSLTSPLNLSSIYQPELYTEMHFIRPLHPPPPPPAASPPALSDFKSSLCVPVWSPAHVLHAVA